MSRRVLVVDDFPDAVEALSMLLTVFGHTTRVANSGSAALALAREELPEIGMFDIGLPDLSGYSLAREIRRLPGGRLPFLVAVTGWGANKDRVDALSAGFDLHVMKPIDATKVADMLRIAEDALRAPDRAAI